MANVKKSTPRKVSTKRKQGHKLIWFTVIVIAIPVIFVAYVLLTSAVGQDKPVVGNRFGSNDLNPKITQDNLHGKGSPSAIRPDCFHPWLQKSEVICRFNRH